MPPRSKRLGVVTTAAVLLFVYATLCVPYGCLGVAISFHPGFGHGPQPAPGQKDELFFVHGLYLFLGIVMVWAGAGVLRLMPGARRAAYWATACHLFLVIVHDIFVLTVVAPQMHSIGMHTLADEGFWALMVFPTIMSFVLALSIITLLSLNGSRAAFGVPASPRRDDFRSCLEAGDDGYRPANRPKNPGDTGITELPDET
jgi:hypothetical protein